MARNDIGAIGSGIRPMAEYSALPKKEFAPLQPKNAGTYSDSVGSGAWANIGPGQARAGYYPSDNEYFASYNWGTNAPGEFKLPDFQANIPTALGNVGIGTNDGNPNVYGTFQPNNATNLYIQALASLLGR